MVVIWISICSIAMGLENNMKKSVFSLDESIGIWKVVQNIFLWLNSFFFLKIVWAKYHQNIFHLTSCQQIVWFGKQPIYLIMRECIFMGLGYSLQYPTLLIEKC